MRRAAGYFRYDTTRELNLLNQLWQLECQVTNFCLPQQKLVSKIRTGAKVAKKYDTAKTPARRLQQDHPGHLSDQDRAAITHTLGELNPAQLRREIASAVDLRVVQVRLVHPGLEVVRDQPGRGLFRRTRTPRRGNGSTPPGPSRSTGRTNMYREHANTITNACTVCLRPVAGSVHIPRRP